MGLHMMGLDEELVDWLMSDNLDITGQLNEVRKAVRLYGAKQQSVQSHVSEAYSPVRVTGMAEKIV